MKNLKPALPHIVAVVIFFVLASVYFAPHYKGYTLHQGDMLTSFGMAKESLDFNQIEKQEAFWTNSAFGGMPTYQVTMTNRTNVLQMVESFLFVRLFDYYIGFLVIAMISFYILLLCFNVNPWLSIVGAIAYGFATINILYLGNGHVTKVHSIALMPGIVGGLIYAYRKSLFVGATIFSIFLCLQISASHIQETYYLVYLVVAIILIEFYNSYKEKLLAKFIKISAVLLIAGVIGILPTLTNLLTTYEHSKYTTRGKSELTINAERNVDKSVGLDRDYIKQYSLGYGEVWSLAVPNIKGGASGYIGNNENNLKDVSPEFKEYVANFPSYWGEQLGSGGAFYFGAIIFLLFVLGMVFITDRLKWAFFAVSILAVFLSWKFSSITNFFIENVPLFNKFRDTKMMLVLAQLSFPFIGILFIKQLFENKLDKKKLNYALIGTIGVFVLFYLLPTVFFSFYSAQENAYFDNQIASYASNPDALKQFDQFRTEIETVRISIFKSDVLRSIFFMAIVGLLIFFYNREKIAKKYFIPLLGVLILTDIWLVDKRYVNNRKENGEYVAWSKKDIRNNVYSASVADKEILRKEISFNPELSKDIEKYIVKLKENSSNSEELSSEQLELSALRFNTNYRVFTLQDPFSNASVSYYHKSIGGYHGAKLKRYQDLIDFRLSKEYQAIINAFNTKKDSAIMAVMDHGIPTLNMLNTKYIIYNPEAAPIINTNALGSAWFVNDVKVVENADAEILALDSINPAYTAVVDKRFANHFKDSFVKDTTAKISITSVNPNHLVYQSFTSSNQLVVFSEIYYADGWNAYIDGKSADYFRANYVLRAMNVPAGKHTIEFKFEPTIVKTARGISMAGSGILLAFIAGIAFMTFKGKSKQKE